jgi:hypothetical protein
LAGENGVLSAPLDSAVQFPLKSLTIDEVQSRTFRNYFTRQPRELPVAITEIDLGVNNPLRVASIDSQCRTDLLEINDIPIALRIVATDNIFDTTQSFKVESCQSLTLQPGENFIRTAKGLDTGVDLDQLVLTTPEFVDTSTYAPITVTSREPTRITATIQTNEPRVVSFGQSINRGWKATLRTANGSVDLGTPFVVQGYANGWWVPESGDLVLEWTPQRFVLGSLVISLLCATGLLLLAFWRPRKQHALNPATDSIHRVSLSQPVMVIFAGLVIAFAGILPALVAGLLLLVSRRLNQYVIGILVMVIAGVIVIQQSRFGYPPTLDWPLRFADLTALTWLAVALACINPVLRRN